MSHILDSAELDEIGNKSWRIDSTSAVLTSPKWRGRLRGKGSLQIDDKGFLLRLYPVGSPRIDVWKTAFSFPPQGEVIADEWYAAGVFRDWQGRYWHLTRFLPKISSGAAGYMVTGRPRFVSCKKRFPFPCEGHGGELHFFPKLEFPPNRYTDHRESMGNELLRATRKLDAAEVQFADVVFRFFDRVHGECEVYSPNAPLPRDWMWRTCEALQFITAKWHEWTVASTRIGQRETVWVRTPQPPERSSIRPPLDSVMSGEAAAAWQMFADYTVMLWQSPDLAPHPISGAHRSIIRASNTTVEAEAIQLCVSIEKILKSQFPEARKSVKIDRSELSRSIDAVKGAKLSSAIERRVLGAISALSNPRAQELIGVLEETNLIRPGWGKTFAALRNPSVHGSVIDGDTQEWLDLCRSGLTLFHELALLKIGYHGPYTDHSRRDSPTILFPPATETAED